jgi:Zn-dependent protease
VGDVDWGWVALVLGVLVPSVMLHEVAHGWVAERFGDDTARKAGRLTLNPIAHIDPVGTILLPVILSLSGVGAFGWAKPVPVSPGRLRNPRSHSLWVGLAGPATNIVLAVSAAVGYRTYGYEWLFWLGAINVILAVFNLLPIPPLDGSAVIERLLPLRWWPTWLRIRQWGMGIVLLLVLVLPGALTAVFEPALDLWARLL